MKQLGLVVVLGAALAAGTTLISPTHAMPVSGLAAPVIANPIEKVQFYIYGGRHYCFYPDGWHGPGWYWCGYQLRRGFGWGGGEGWRGWHRGGGGFGFHGHGFVHGGGHFRGGHIGGGHFGGGHGGHGGHR